MIDEVPARVAEILRLQDSLVHRSYEIIEGPSSFQVILFPAIGEPFVYLVCTLLDDPVVGLRLDWEHFDGYQNKGRVWKQQT